MTGPDDYKNIEDQAGSAVDGCSSLEQLKTLKAEYTGRNGIVNGLFSRMSEAPAEERPVLGRELNQLKNRLNDLFSGKEKELSEGLNETGFFDPTLPAGSAPHPPRHVITKTLSEITDLFSWMGFGVAYGPEVETDYYNFTALNFPKDHPAKDMHDTLYLERNGMLLRTHTSPVQVRMMEAYEPPFKFIAPGKCYRRDTVDASHSPVFHQVEGLLIDRNIRFSHLKGVLKEFAVRFFPGDIDSRFRPSFFPFTEPSAEMDISCSICSGEGCSSCAGKGWLEILGAGMVDPAVLENCSIDPNSWQGFAFGMGVERLAMLKYGITDMRLFYQNDIRFLRQFP